jgi:hypothetical protein
VAQHKGFHQDTLKDAPDLFFFGRDGSADQAHIIAKLPRDGDQAGCKGFGMKERFAFGHERASACKAAIREASKES